MNHKWILIFTILNIKLQISFQQIYESCSTDKSQCCDNSCSSCSQVKISQCTNCQPSYFYQSMNYSCVQNCPNGTYTINETKQCIQCQSKYCTKCTDNACLQCNPGFKIDPNNNKNCISICSQQNMVLDEQGQCNISCLDDSQFEIDYESNICIPKQACPTLEKIPQITNKADIISILIDKSNKLMTSIDKLGNVVLFSFPDLKEQLGYTLPVNSSQKIFQNSKQNKVIDCNYLNDSDLINQIISCMLSPINLLSFFSQNGTIVNEQQINDRTFVKSYDSGKNWNLIQALKDQYELQLINYTTTTSITLETVISSSLIATVVKKSVVTKSTQVMSFNQADGKVAFYETYPVNKTFVICSNITDPKAKFIQLNSFNYWMIYTSNSYQLMRFNSDSIIMYLLSAVNLLQNINSIYLQNNAYDIIFVFGTNSLSFKLMQLDEIQGIIAESSQLNTSQLQQKINYVNKVGNLYISCSSVITNAFQFSTKNRDIKFMIKLRENNSDLCSISTFLSYQIDQTIYVFQIVSRNINLNTFNTITNENTSSYFANFQDTQNVQIKLSDRVQYNYLLVENAEKQILMEYKSFGLVYMYDLMKKVIVNQVRYWYPYNELITQLFFNSVAISDNLYLFVGFESNTFKIKIINLKTFEIKYEQEIPQVVIPLSELNLVMNPVYFPNSGNIIVQILRKKITNDLQKRYDFFFIQKIQNQDSYTYQYINGFTIAGYNFLYSLQSEILIIFDLQSTQYYKAYFYNISGQKVFNIDAYHFRDLNRFGQVDENNKKAYIFGFYQVVVVNLITLKSTTQVFNNQCNYSYVFSLDFKLVYIQDSCIKEGVFTYPDNKLKTPNGPISSFIYVYTLAGNYIIFKTYSTSQIIYDIEKNLIFRKNSIHGNNNGGFIQETQGVFFNANAVDHYDLVSTRLIFSEDNSIPYTYVLQTQKLRNNYAISNKQNIFQVKKYNELILAQHVESTQDGISLLYYSYVSELNILIHWTVTNIRIYDSFDKTPIKEISYNTYVRGESSDNFVTQEVFTRKIFYYRPSNIIIAIFFRTMVCLDASTFEIVYQIQYQTDIEAFKSVAIDMELGYLISTNLNQDCIFNMRTIQRNCYKDSSQYEGLKNQPLNDYTQELFINQKSKMLIICQMTSIRVFSLRELSYKSSIYDVNLDAAQFFYNPYYNYIIYSQKVVLQFTLFDLNTYQKKKLPLSSPSKDYQSTNYRFYFFADQLSYLYVNSNDKNLQTYNQQTHQWISTIQFDDTFFPYSTLIVDEPKKYIFLVDIKNNVQHISYETNKLIYKYQLNDTELIGYKNMIYDSYKQKLIVNTRYTIYVISIIKQIIEFTYFEKLPTGNDGIVQVQFFPNRNIFQYSTFRTCVLFDYDYLTSDCKDLFPNQIQPRIFQVNENVVFHINDVNSQATLYINKKIKTSWIRNNLLSGYIRIIENDLQNQLVYAINDKEISIIDLSSNEIIQIDQYFHSSNIIDILNEDSNYIFLQSQSQQILTLPKKAKNVQINVVMILPNGIATHYFIKNSTQFLCMDYIVNTNITIYNLISEQGKLKGVLNQTISLESRIVNFQIISDSLIVILQENKLITYDIFKKDFQAAAVLPIKHIFANIKVDLIFNRIFVQNKLTGSLIYNFSLTHSGIEQINTFSTDLQFDDFFIYSITGHSANIYFRKDLQFLTNFRHFQTNYSLKKISYLGEGYLFLVEFLTKLSIYELSPFGNLPIEKNFININQFIIVNFRLQKLFSDKNDYSYSVKVTGFKLEGMFIYSSKIDKYSSQIQQSCSGSMLMQQQIYQETNIFNQLVQQLQSQNRTLSGLIVPISTGQYLRLPQVQNEIIGNTFELTIIGNNDFEKIFLSNGLDSLNVVTYLKFKQMEIVVDPIVYKKYQRNNQLPNSIEINRLKYPKLNSILIENIKLNEVSFNLENMSKINMKNIIISNIVTQNQMPALTWIKLNNSQSISISSITIDSCVLELVNPLIHLSNINEVTIKEIKIINGSFKGLNSLFYVQNVTTLIIDSIVVSNNYFTETSLFFVSSVGLFKMNELKVENIVFKSDAINLLLQTTEDIEESDKFLFNFQDIDQILIFQLKLNYLELSSNQNLFLFSMKHIKTYLNIQNGIISNISLKKNQNGIIFSFTGINEVKLNMLQVNSISQIQFLVLQEYKISKLYNFFCNKIVLLNCKIFNYTISQNIIKISSFITQIDLFTFYSIIFNNDVQQKFSAIEIQSIENLQITNSQFEFISQFKESAINIKNSKNVIIEKSSFIDIYTQGSTSVIQIEDSNKIKINLNLFQENKALLDSGCISFKDSQNISISNNKFIKNISMNGQGGCIFSANSNFDNIDNNFFYQNQAQFGSGGAIFCQDGIILSAKSNQFLENSAVNGSGGAILLNNCDLQAMSSNEFNSNSAFIGGAIRYKVLKPLILINQEMSVLKRQNIFAKNIYRAYGKDIGSYPIILDVKSSFDDDYGNSLNGSFIDDVQSGYKAQDPILLRFIDEEMREVNFVDFNFLPYVMKEIKEEFSLYILQASSELIGLQGDLKQGYSKDDMSFKFDLSFSYQPMSQSKLTIKSTQALPQFIRNQQTTISQQFEISITVKFRKCQIGEIEYKSGEYIQCHTCEQGFYSIIDPYSQNNLSCKKCPQGSISCYGTQIELMNGYWRENEMSDDIVFCSKNPQNCQPENKLSKLNCIEGHIGPMCLECDIKGIIWGKPYGKGSSTDCFDCKQFLTFKNISVFILIFAFIFSQILGKIKKQQNDTKKRILITSLKQLGFRSASLYKYQTEISSLFKILINYFQFVMIINSLEIQATQFNSMFDFYSAAGGDTSKNTFNMLDCAIFTFQTSLPTYVLKVLWVNMQPLILFFCVEIASQLTLKNRSPISIKQSIYTNLIILFTFYQPTVTKILIQSQSCRDIGNKSYILIDLSQECLSDEHLYYILVLFLPLTLFWVVFGPLFLFWRLKHYKNEQNRLKILYRYSYLYNVKIVFIIFFLLTIFFPPLILTIYLLILCLKKSYGQGCHVQNISNINFNYSFINQNYEISNLIGYLQCIYKNKQEYRPDRFYWDIIRMFLRSLTIIIINLFNFNVIFKGLVFIGLIIAYLYFQSRNSPYLEENLNKLDKESCYLVIKTLYMIFISELSYNEILQFIISLCLLVINSIFLLKMTRLIVMRPITPIESERTIIEKILYYLKIKCPKAFFWIEIGRVKKTNVFRNWKKLRVVIQSILNSNKMTKQYQKLNVMRQMRLQQQQELQRSSFLQQFVNQNNINLNIVITYILILQQQVTQNIPSQLFITQQMATLPSLEKTKQSVSFSQQQDQTKQYLNQSSFDLQQAQCFTITNINSSMPSPRNQSQLDETLKNINKQSDDAFKNINKSPVGSSIFQSQLQQSTEDGLIRKKKQKSIKSMFFNKSN